jgi:integrase
MKPTLKIALDQRRKKETGLYPVKLQMTFLRETKRYSIGLDLTQDQFEYVLNPTKYKNRFDVATRRKLTESQFIINAMFTKASEIIKSIDFSFQAFENKFYQKKLANTDVYQFYGQIIERLREKNRLGTADAYQCSLVSLKQFRPDLKFKDITASFLESFERWMLGRGRSVSTVGIYLRPLRAVMNEAIADGIISRETNYPFGKRLYQIPASKNIKKALTLEEMSRFFHFETLQGSWQDKARDFFLFSYLGNGINMKDICLLKNRDIEGEYIRFTRAKTQHTNRSSNMQISIYISPEIQAIIDKWRNPDQRPDSYLFPILEEDMNAEKQMLKIKQFTKNVNSHIKKIAVIIQIDKQVTTYFARHSFATILKRSGASTEMISESLGHSNLKTTASYLDSFEDEKRKEIVSVLTKFTLAKI